MNSCVRFFMFIPNNSYYNVSNRGGPFPLKVLTFVSISTVLFEGTGGRKGQPYVQSGQENNSSGLTTVV